MIRLLLVGAAAFLAGTAAHSQVNPSGLKWGPAPPGLPKGARLAVLSGDPNKAGLFTIRMRFPPGYSIAPHHHPTDELVTVLGGQLQLGMGRTISVAKAKTLIEGGYVVAPANMNHFAFTKGGATVQITARGPFEITYVNPKDDPRNNR
jgi:quercetin dioxygenase-like cupin family protein